MSETDKCCREYAILYQKIRSLECLEHQQPHTDYDVTVASADGKGDIPISGMLAVERGELYIWPGNKVSSLPLQLL